MSLQEQLSRAISEHAVTATEPVPDLAGAIRRGRGLRRRRHFLTLAASGVTGALVIGAALAVTRSADPDVPGSQEFVPVGQLDYSSGLRAFASPDADGELWLGGRSFPQKDMGYLDTDATATPYGMVFFDRAGQARLLAQDGTFRTLAPAPEGHHPDDRMSAKADARLPFVAFTQPGADGVEVILHDLETGRTVATVDVPCSGTACEDVRVDGLDRGLVFVRTAEGTFVWDHTAAGSRRWTLLGEGKFRVADARNGRVLWSGAPPTPSAESPVADWSFTRGEIDAELSFDGRHVLYWSATLEPVEKGGAPIRLEVKNAGWFTFDTDGSVLAATTGSDQTSTVYDCQLPLVTGGSVPRGRADGHCQRIGSISTESGDPVFIGNDM